MIPSDVASSLRQILPDQQSATNPQAGPVTPAQRVIDALSDLVPGQRVLAQIQAMLPNGNYRAVIAQRDVTLALPFAAKAGDSVELEVVESDGKITLAFVANRGSEEGAAAKNQLDSASTTLSTAGKVIGNLLNGLESEGKRAPPAPLNGNQALVETMPKSAAELAPVLKQALTQSGVFYEAHQARWVSGNFPTESLRHEPQGKLSPPPIPLPQYIQPSAPEPAPGGIASAPLPPSAAQQAAGPQALPATTLAAQPAETPQGEIPKFFSPQGMPIPAENLAKGSQVYDLEEAGKQAPQAPLETDALPQQSTAYPQATKTEHAPPPGPANLPTAATSQGVPTNPNTAPGTPFPRELTPLVQQQLDGLATQNFAWQGQVWPGQQMRWEIAKNPDDNRAIQGDPAAQWQTRLKLSLPRLGDIDVTLRLRAGNELAISASTHTEDSEARLREHADQLRQQFEAAGLNLAQLTVNHAARVE